MPSPDYLMLRSAQRARLEARTAPLQLIFPITKSKPIFGDLRWTPKMRQLAKVEPCP